MPQDYVLIGLICLTSIVIPGVLLGLPLYRRHLALNWLETPAPEALNEAAKHSH